MFDELAERYRADLRRRGFAVKSIEAYMLGVVGLLKFLEERGVETPSEITREVVVDYQAALYTARSWLGRPLALRTQHMRLVILTSFLSFLVRQGRMLLNPADGLERPRFGPRNPPRNVATEVEVAALLAAVDTSTAVGTRDKAMLEVLYVTGMRVGELIKLKVYDVDLITRVARIIAGKGGKDRVVPLGRVALRALHAYLAKVRPELVGTKEASALFVSNRGRRLCPGTVQRQIKIWGRAAGQTRVWTAHALRHACATHMLRGGASIRHIQELLGHRQLSTTQLYTQVEIEDLKVIHARTHPRERAPAKPSARGRGRSTDGSHAG